MRALAQLIGSRPRSIIYAVGPRSSSIDEVGCRAGRKGSEKAGIGMGGIIASAPDSRASSWSKTLPARSPPRRCRWRSARSRRSRSAHVRRRRCFSFISGLDSPRANFLAPPLRHRQKFPRAMPFPRSLGDLIRRPAFLAGISQYAFRHPDGTLIDVFNTLIDCRHARSSVADAPLQDVGRPGPAQIRRGRHYSEIKDSTSNPDVSEPIRHRRTRCTASAGARFLGKSRFLGGFWLPERGREAEAANDEITIASPSRTSTG